jgi:Thrombospondin type 3 repeat
VPNKDQKDSNNNGIGDACEPAVAKCDIDGDGDIDKLDIAAITALRNKPASANPKADADGNGIININDARACTLKCTRASCATQ